MLKLGPSNVVCTVFTFKEGLLSGIAHDLKLDVSKFEIETRISAKESGLSEWNVSIKAAFDPASLRTVCAMKDGKELPAVLKQGDRKDIDAHIVTSVLKPGKYPKILFASSEVSGDLKDLRVKGKLTLCGVARTIVVPVTRSKNNYVAEVTLHQPDFGIKPFSALLGAMKVKPEIKVRMTFALG